MGWILNTTTNDIYTEDTVQGNVHVCYTAPYGNFLWSVNQAGNDVIPPGGALSYHTPCFTAPFPSALWYVTSNPNDVTHAGTLDVAVMGAFARTRVLKEVSIPSTLTSIGPYSFAESGIRSITLPTNCTYYSTSFPVNCVVTGGHLIT